MSLFHQRIFITGGAGFIGSALVRHLIGATGAHVLNFDKLTYAGNLSSVASATSSPRYSFIQGDITDYALLQRAFDEFQPDAVINLAAESHVDRSINSASPFIMTNIVGTYTMLECAGRYWEALSGDARERFRFLHVSTDEVYGSLGPKGLFREDTPYAPRSPYSASKASSDHLVSAGYHTYGLPALITNCSNNYGPFQHPEKLIPLCILNAIHGEPLPVYGKGENVRDWLYVDDHVKALVKVLARGVPGQTYNIGGSCEMRNIDVVESICRILDGIRPAGSGRSYSSRIEFVSDRPGHDFRYAIDAGKARRELGWEPQTGFEEGLGQTVRWYLDNERWWSPLLTGEKG